jgi:hypothetical protein
MRIVDQYMGFYTPLVLVIGALVWTFTQDLSRVIAVFIVACPCAFILATPTAMVAALSAAARLGILIKNVANIELAARINAFVFDKTGTLTSGASPSAASPPRRHRTRRTAAHRRLRRTLQQPPHRQGSRRPSPTKPACRSPSPRTSPKPPAAASRPPSTAPACSSAAPSG